MKGEKSPFRWLWMKFPAAGIPEEEIKKAGIFGDSISKSLISGNFENLQEQLVSAGAVKVDPVLMNIEKRGKMMFGIWAKMILKKGAYNDPAREGRLKGFKFYLFTVIYLISPLVSGLFKLKFFINPKASKKIISKYSGVK